jgi:Phosphatidylglycerophosphate synthase
MNEKERCEMRNTANCISIARIVLTLALLLTKPFSVLFLALYLAAGASDVLDGYIARKTKTTSKLGEKLDSAADIVLVAVLLVILFSFITVELWVILWIGFIAALKILSVIIVYIKYKIFGMLHTIANKVMGMLLFLFPLLYSAIQSDALIYALCAAATLTAVEELVINIRSKEWNANQKGYCIRKGDVPDRHSQYY